MAELLDGQSLKLPFDRKMQQAVMGHMLDNQKFFAGASLKIRPEWFTEDLLIGKLYRLAKLHSERYHKHPTGAELMNHPEIRAEPLKSQSEYKERLAAAKQAKDEISLKFIQDQLTDWYVAMTWRAGIEKATDFYNRGQFDRVTDLFTDLAKQASGMRFDDLPAVDFENYESMFEHMEYERSNALSFGISSIDAALMDGATKESGGMLRGDTTLLIAASNVGKTSACTTVIGENLKNNQAILYLSHEGRWEDLVAKIWQNLLRVTQKELVTLQRDPQGRKRINFVMKYLTRNLVYMPYNKPGMVVEDVFPMMMRAQEERIAKTGKGFDLIVDDYPAKLYTRRAERSAMPRREVDRVVYDHFVQFAHDNNCHCLVPIQANRTGSKVNNGAEGRVVTKEDTSEAWGPVEMSANVITMNRPPRGKQEGWVEFYIDKSRSSETGTIVACRTRYDWSTTHAEDMGSVFWQGQETREERVLQFLNGFSNDQKGKHNRIPDALVR